MNHHYLSQKFSSLRRFGFWMFGDSAVGKRHVDTENSSVAGEMHLWYDCQKDLQKQKLTDNLQTMSESSALYTLLQFFLLLSVCPVKLVRHWCHSCALCHLNLRDDLELGSLSQSFNVCVLEQNKMLQLHQSGFSFYVQTTKMSLKTSGVSFQMFNY